MVVSAGFPVGTSPRTRGKHRRHRGYGARPRNIPAHAGKTFSSCWAIFSAAEHPRARGENITGEGYALADKGTSPRTRGKPIGCRMRCIILRNIPAHAGKTHKPLPHDSRGREHPRARGENEGRFTVTVARLGTSPRTRGKHHLRKMGQELVRNIPAHAGKTYSLPLPVSAVPEHPRARGENHVTTLTQNLAPGTSPRTRGKHHQRAGEADIIRNIPAHAGKTTITHYGRREGEEHPRARGENVFRRLKIPVPYGTSPRTRGKPSSKVHLTKDTRNIPAHAGKTESNANANQVFQEHPRARGENANLIKSLIEALGTSPRTRGKLLQSVTVLLTNRNIPAHAGKTMPRTTSGRITQEHPRARGENKHRHHNIVRNVGTSPRTRGKRPGGGCCPG